MEDGVIGIIGYYNGRHEYALHMDTLTDESYIVRDDDNARLVTFTACSDVYLSDKVIHIGRLTTGNQVGHRYEVYFSPLDNCMLSEEITTKGVPGLGHLTNEYSEWVAAEYVFLMALAQGKITIKLEDAEPYVLG